MSGILDDFPRGVGEGRFKTEHYTPQASWRPMRDILADPALHYDPNHPGGKLLLGTLEDQLIGVADDRHMITVAGSRAGKGVSVIVPNLIFYPGSVLAIDPKGELASITARRRAEGLGQKVFVLDPFDRTADWVKPYKASFNPMAILDPDKNRHIVEDAGLIADALVVPGGGNEIHWDETAKNFIEGLILHVATFPDYKDKRNLITVRELLVQGTEPHPQMLAHEGLKKGWENADSKGMYALRYEMSLNNELGGLIQAAAKEMFERDPKEMNSVLSSARRHTTFLGFPSIKKVLVDHPTLHDLRSLKTMQGGVTIYLCLPAGRLATCSRWLRLFVNLALEAMEREQRVDPKRKDSPVLLCLDEFATLGRMEQIEAAAGQIAGFGCKLWPILQDLGQLEALYKERWQTFVGNAGVLQFFGNNDVKTLEYISKRLGQTSLLVKSKGDVTFAQSKEGSTGLSQAIQVFDLMTAEEAGRFFARDAPHRRQLIIRAGKDPAMAIGRVAYYEDPVFRGKFDHLDDVREEKTTKKTGLGGFFSGLAGNQTD